MLGEMVNDESGLMNAPLCLPKVQFELWGDRRDPSHALRVQDDDKSLYGDRILVIDPQSHRRAGGKLDLVVAHGDGFVHHNGVNGLF